MAKNEESLANMEETVYRRIRNAIYKRYIRPSSQLVETTIAEQLGVSRTPVRAALKRLVYDGFAQIIPNKGVFVIKPTIKEIKDAFAVRMFLETKAAGLAADNINNDDINYLCQLQNEEKLIFESRDIDNYYHFNDSFHFTIAELSGNPILSEYIHNIVGRTTIYLILFDPFYQMEINPSIDEHLHIIEALKRKDSADSSKAMEIHLASAMEGMNLQEIEESVPEDFLFI